MNISRFLRYGLFVVCLTTILTSTAYAESKTQPFGSSKYENIMLYLGSNGSVTCTFYIDGVFGNTLNSFRTDWYSTQDIEGEAGFIESDPSNAGNGYWDPEVTRTYYSVGTYWVRGEVMTRNYVYQDFWWKETHQWRVTVLGDTTPPSNPTSWSGDAVNEWRTDNTVYVSWSGAKDNVALKGYYYLWTTSSSSSVSTSAPYKPYTSGSHNQTSKALDDGLWYFHVRYQDTSNNLASSTAHRGPFKIDRTKPDPPTLIWPTDDSSIDTRRPKLDWSKPSDNLSGVVEYEVTYETTAFNDERKRTTSSSYYQISEDLSYNDWWYWHVRAKDAAGNWGEESEELRFKIPAVPNLVTTDIWLSKSTPLDAGDTVDVYAKVKNIGNAKANPSWIDYIWSQLKVNGQVVAHSNGDNLNYVWEIEVDEERTYKFSGVVVPHTATMTCLVIADTHTSSDMNNRVAESSETDNDDYSESFPVDLPGTMSVTINPASAVNAGAKWKATKSGHDTGWQNSGASPSVPAGVYTITFNMPSGWGAPSGARPADIPNVTVAAGQTVQSTGTYRRIVSAYWDETEKTVVGGTSVTMRATVEGFAAGTEFAFTVTEGGLARGLARGSYEPVYGTCNASGIVTAEWPAVWEDDGLIGEPEFYFTITNRYAMDENTPTFVSKNSPTDLTVLQRIESAEITGFTPETKIKKYGEQTTVKVTVKNTGTVARSFWVGLSFASPLSGEWPEEWLDISPVRIPDPNDPNAKLSPGASTTVNFNLTIGDEMPEGAYDAWTAVWDGFDADASQYEREDGQVFSVDGLMTGQWFDSEEKDAFIVSSTGLEADPFTIGQDDPGGLFASIPVKHRGAGAGELLDLPINLVDDLVDVKHGGQALTESNSRVMVLFHGWNWSWAWADTPEDAYDDEEFGDLKDNLIANLPANWSLVPYHWEFDADTGFLWPDRDASTRRETVVRAVRVDPGTVIVAGIVAYVAVKSQTELNATVAAYRSYMHGLVLGRRLVEQVGAANLQQVHLVGHSAGSWGVYAAMRYLRTHVPGAEVQVTFLDPFIPAQTYEAPLDSHRQAFNGNVLGGSAGYTSVATPGAYKADCYWSESDETEWGEDVTAAVAIYFPPPFDTLIGHVVDVLSEPTTVEWTWNGIAGTTVVQTDPYWYMGHSSPVQFYADSVAYPGNAMFQERGWNVSLAKNFVSTRVIALSPSPLAFGNVPVTTPATSSSRTLTITNTGNSPLHVAGITYSGADAGAFSGTWSGDVPPDGGSQSVTVWFSPSEERSYATTLTVNSDKTSGTNTVSCTGTGIRPAMLILGRGNVIANGSTETSTGNDTDFGTVQVGGSPVLHEFTIRNTGTANLTVGTVTRPTGFSVTKQPSSPVGPNGGQTTFRVQLDTASAGIKDGWVEVQNNGTPPYKFWIRGVVEVPTVTISATDANAAEPIDCGTFTVTRTGATTSSLSVNLASPTGTATDGIDYHSVGTMATIPVGQSSTTVVVTPINDTDVEGPETVILGVTSGAGYTVGTPSSATVTIADNDPEVTDQVDPPTFNPDGGAHPGPSVNVTVSCSTAGATIHYTTNGSEPTESDQTVASGNIVQVQVPGTLKAKAWKAGMNASDTKTAGYTEKPKSLVFWEGNLHFYELIEVPEGITWDQARSAAKTATHNGIPGYLATINSAEENSFIVEYYQNVFQGSAWIGGDQESGKAPDQGWRWVTGEPWTYTNWRITNPEPNDCDGVPEDALEIMLNLNDATAHGYWNDALGYNQNGHYYYLVEYPSMYCRRTSGGTLNGQPVDEHNNAVEVIAEDFLQGSFNVIVNNTMHRGAVSPLAATVTWGDRTTQYWTVNRWIGTGVNTYSIPVDCIAPETPGDYYLIVGFSGMYNGAQVMSSTTAGRAAVWNDGNDVGFDWTESQFSSALGNNGIVWVNMLQMDNNFPIDAQPFTAIKIHVEKPLSAEYPLTQGWNLISINLNLTEKSQQLLQTKKAATLSPTGDAYVFSSHLTPPQACWIFSQSAETITLTGTSPENFDFVANLKKGWNFVGPMEDSLLRGNAAIAWGWDGQHLYPTKSILSGSGYYLYWPEDQAEIIPRPDDYLVIDLSVGPDAASYPVSTLAAIPPGGWTDEYKTTKLVLRKIPAGTFIMGSPEGELGRNPDETQHQVTLTKDFYVGVFEVTQKQWERVMGTWPSYFSNASYRDARPVEQVSYEDIRGSNAGSGWPANNAVDADSFMRRLRFKTGLDFDLPTESQWEYACRAGTTTALNSGKNLTNTGECSNVAEVGRYWYNGRSGYSSGGDTSGGSAKVGSYLPNQWGLYDMHGNVYEWCLDWRDWSDYPSQAVTDPKGAAGGSNRVLRGGSWGNYALYCRSANRCGGWPSLRFDFLGFRLVRAVP